MAKKKAAPKPYVEEPDDEQDREDQDSETPAGQLGDWGDKVPPEVQQEADSYMQAMRAQNDAKAATNTARENCIKVMKQHGIERVKIDDNGKFLVCEEVSKLKTEKIKADDNHDRDDD